MVFCDLVDSTGLSTEVEAHEDAKIIGEFQRTALRVMKEFGGFVAHYAGDVTLTFFGYPQAREEDAQLAVEAAMQAVEAISSIALPASRRIQAHVGIATGLAAVGDIVGIGGAGTLGIAGSTPNIAARLQQFAPAGTVVADENTRRMTGSAFEWRELGLVSLKGLRTPVEAFQVVGLRHAAGRYDDSRRDALTPMVGREPVLAQLLERWHAVQSGTGRVVIVSGDAGIGKSRLVEEFVAQLKDAKHARLRYFCSLQRQNSPLYPIIQQIEYSARFDLGDAAQTRLDKLEALLSGLPQADLGLVAELLLLPIRDCVPPVQLSPQKKRERLMGVLIGILEQAARDVPLLVILEDAQWADASTRHLLGIIASRVASHRILCVITARPQFDPPWLNLPDAMRITLGPLQAEEAASLVDRVARARPLSRRAVEDIVARTDGIPLYIEEMTRSVIEGGGQGQEAARPNVPVSLQAFLLARIDRLGPAREVAKLASAIGRDFARDLLTEIANVSAHNLDAAVERLVESGVVVRRSTLGVEGAGFRFRHMLLRDAAYNLMVPDARKVIHARIADALEGRFPKRAAANPEIVAFHCSEGGLIGKAAKYWLAAGHQALRRSAMAEALTQLGQGLECVRALPADEARDRCELDLMVAIGKAQIATQGYTARGTGETYSSAYALCRRLHDPPQLLSVLHGLWTHALMRADLTEAKRQALGLLARGDERDDALWLLMGCRFSGVTHHPLGVFSEARSYLQRGLALYRTEQAGQYAMITVDDPRVVMLTYLSWSLMCAGELDRAGQCGAQALAEARNLGHAYTLAHALNGAAFLALTMATPQQGLELLGELTRLVEEHGIAYYGAVATLFRGWCVAALGDAAQAAPLLRTGLAAYRATGSVLYLPGFLRMCAEAHGRIGQQAVALEQIAEASRLMSATEQRWDEAEIDRVHAGLVLAAGDADSAAAKLERALSVARAQGAGLWELRVACDLAQLHGERGERCRAHELLEPVCARFALQSERPDVSAARSLLANLR